MSAQPRYGVDAPGVVRGLLGSGAVGLGLGAAFIAFGKPPWTDAVGALLAAAALVPTGLGLSMVAYATGGKLVLRDALLNRLEWRGDEIVLDVGAGRGLMAVGAAKRVPRGRVLALDIWSRVDLSGNGPEALATNARLERVADRIEIVTGDARKLDLPDASVDVVVSVLCIHNIEPAADREGALREIVRVLKPGGRAMIADYIKTGKYAGVLKRTGLEVSGPTRMDVVARTLMAVVEGVKRDA